MGWAEGRCFLSARSLPAIPLWCWVIYLALRWNSHIHTLIIMIIFWVLCLFVSSSIYFKFYFCSLLFSLFFFLSAFILLYCPFKLSLGSEPDPLIAAFLCVFCLTQSLWALYKCPAQFLPLPSPSTSPSHSAILRASPAMPPSMNLLFCHLNSCADSTG